MPIVFQRVAIVGATGPTGRALVRELTGRRIAVRAISRSMARLVAAFPYDPIEKRSADARDVVGLSAAVAGCDLVVDCIGLPVNEMEDHSVAARTLAAVLRAGRARAIQVSSTWSYMPIGKLPLSEDHPREGGPPWAQARRAAEDALREAGAAIVHLPDFFGPHVHTSTLHMGLGDAVAGKPMRWLGRPGARRDYIFVPDAMRIVAELAIHADAYGTDWIIPGSGPVTAGEIAEMVARLLGQPVQIKSAGMTLLRLVALFDHELRGFLQIAPEYAKPVSYDGQKLDALIGTVARTPYREALRITLNWLRSEQA